MSVNIQRRAGLRMTEYRRNGFHVDCVACDRGRRVGMAESVKSFECQLLLVAEFVQPSVRSVRMKRFAVPADEQAIGFYPLITEFYALLILFKLIELHESDGTL